MPTKFRELEKMLKGDGWTRVRATGSHYIFRHPVKGTVAVPFHGDNKEIKPGMLRAYTQKGGLDPMKLTATVEAASDGTFTAVAVIAEHTVIGDGDTREEALTSLRDGIASLIEYLKSEGEPLLRPSIELVSIEVAA